MDTLIGNQKSRITLVQFIMDKINTEKKMEGREKRRKETMGGIHRLGKDVWSVILKHLILKDIEPLRLSNKDIETKIRVYFFSNYAFYIARIPDSCNLPVVIKNVRVHDVKSYQRLMNSNLFITHFAIASHFDGSIVIPESVTHFRTGWTFNLPIDIPQNVTHLTLGEMFNQHIVLPPSVIYFETGFNFNQPVVLPPNVLHFEMGSAFNQPIVIPPSVKYLELGFDFNQPIIIPPNVIHFEMGKHFNQPIVIPPSVIYLVLGFDFNQPITIPACVRKLEIMSIFPRPIIIPPSVKDIYAFKTWEPFLGKYARDDLLITYHNYSDY